jgi:hypothetical protein
MMDNLSRDSLSLGSTTNLSLSVNYIPSKFSEFMNRKGDKYEPNLQKQGGGLHAFKTKKTRIPQGKGRLRWNKFKWVLIGTNSLVCFYVFPFLPCHFFHFSYYTAHALLHRRSRHLSPNMVRRLVRRRCHTHREQTRANPINNGSLRRHLHLSHRLGRYPQ